MKKLYTTIIEKDLVLNYSALFNYYYGEELHHIYLKWDFPIKVKANDTLTIIYSDKNDVVKKVHNVFVNGIEVKKKRWWQLSKREQ